MSGVKKTFLEDRVFLLAETHPNSVCSWFAPWPTKPLRGEKAGSGKGETQMLSTALDKKQVFWFMCCVGNSNKQGISLQALVVSFGESLRLIPGLCQLWAAGTSGVQTHFGGISMEQHCKLQKKTMMCFHISCEKSRVLKTDLGHFAVLSLPVFYQSSSPFAQVSLSNPQKKAGCQTDTACKVL